MTQNSHKSADLRDISKGMVAATNDARLQNTVCHLLSGAGMRALRRVSGVCASSAETVGNLAIAVPQLEARPAAPGGDDTWRSLDEDGSAHP
jgi:hypothetical protein